MSHLEYIDPPASVLPPLKVYFAIPEVQSVNDSYLSVWIAGTGLDLPLHPIRACWLFGFTKKVSTR
jgi:hypothetical protein